MSPSLLDRILAPDGVTSYCQPIVAVNGQLAEAVSVELLTRGPRDTRFENPCLLFDYVRRVNAEVMVDKRCIAEGLHACGCIPTNLRVGVNVHASTLERDKHFAQFLAEAADKNGVAPSRITVEIVEHSPCWSQPDFLQRLAELRELNVRIALDDVGTGHSNYRMILDVRPDYFKVDSYIVRAAHNDHSRQAILRSIICLSQELGGKVIAEGVEQREDLETLLQLGIDHIQGYLFSRPFPTRAFSSEWEASSQAVETLTKPRLLGGNSLITGIHASRLSSV